MDKKKAPEGTLEVKQEYSKTLASGTEVKFTIFVDIVNLEKNDVEEAHSEFAMFARRFCLHMCSEINNAL